NGGRVGPGAGDIHACLEGERPREPKADGADVPHPGGAVVGPLARGSGDQGQSGRQQVAYAHVGGGGGGGVGQGDGKGDGVAHVGRRVADGFHERQVGLLRRLGGTGAVVAGGRVELIAAANGGGVGLGGGTSHLRLDKQGLRRRGGHGAHSPEP